MPRKIMLIIFVLVSLIIAGCDILTDEQDEGLKASGVVEAVEIAVAPQIGGRVLEVYAQQGDPVIEDDLLFQLENYVLESQYEQARAAKEAVLANLEVANSSLDQAEAALTTAQTTVKLAQIQFQQTVQLARLEDQPNRINNWNRQQPDEFDTPAWIFTKTDEMAAAETEMKNAQEALDEATTIYTTLIQSPEYADLRAAEVRLAQAQAAFLVAQALREREIAPINREQLDDTLETQFAGAETELVNAQEELDAVLADDVDDVILNAKARLAVAQERYNTAYDLWSSMFTGDHSLQVSAAQIVLEQAQANVAQAEAAVAQAKAGISAAEKVSDQAQAAIEVIEIQMELLNVSAPADGVIMVRNVETGEVIQAGYTAMTLGVLDELHVTVYIPEDMYGQISLGDSAQVTSDSFPGEVFQGVVIRISDRAEYTPRNVQTEEDRSTLVFAIELTVDDTSGKLKPGMPVDVRFDR